MGFKLWNVSRYMCCEYTSKYKKGKSHTSILDLFVFKKIKINTQNRLFLYNTLNNMIDGGLRNLYPKNERIQRSI
jgi:hypothetical protein